MEHIRHIPIVGRAVIFYGAGKYAQDNFLSLQKQASGCCFADNNPDKHHSKLCGLDVLPLHETIRKYPDFDILITVSYENVREIKEYLEAQDIPNDRIIYPDELEFRSGCVYLETGEWSTFGGKTVKVVSECYGDLKLKRTGTVADDLLLIETARQKARASVLNGETCSCDECFVNIEDFYVKQIYHNTELSVVFESNYKDTVCNVRCCYCTAYDDKRYLLDKDILESGNRFIDDWRQLIRLYADKCIYVAFANGEMTVSPWRDEVLCDLLNTAKNWNLLIPTNGVEYNADIARLMRLGRVQDLMISLDAGTRETFQKIRGVDCFEKVISNIRRYKETSERSDCISIKYIILEGLNDNRIDIDCFVNIASELQVKVIISNDNFTLQNPMSDNVRNTIKFLADKLKSKKLQFFFGRHCFLATDYRWLQTLK
ncbi:hypothetical protein FACS1894216_11800 [Synergistales bacterium]|nr:hypothetical protein FACS1894216_11800 [Synergistales bacterium]